MAIFYREFDPLSNQDLPPRREDLIKPGASYACSGWVRGPLGEAAG